LEIQSQKFTKTDIETTIPYLTTPTLITGDFNGWNSLWGSPKSNRRVTIFGDYIHSNNYIILNNGQPTHFSTHNSYTHIDLAFCSPNLKIHCDFKIMDTPQGSHHSPIKMYIFTQENQTFTYTKRFITKRANIRFESLTNPFNKQIPVSTNTNKENINKIILNSACYSIPQTQPPKSQYNVLWWNKNLDDLKVSKNRAWRAFNNAQLRQEIRLSKKEDSCTNIQYFNDSKPDMIWSKIRQFCGIDRATHTFSHIHCI